MEKESCKPTYELKKKTIAFHHSFSIRFNVVRMAVHKPSDFNFGSTDIYSARQSTWFHPTASSRPRLVIQHNRSLASSAPPLLLVGFTKSSPPLRLASVGSTDPHRPVNACLVFARTVFTLSLSTLVSRPFGSRRVQAKEV